jgi:hypothetical protein
MHKENTNTGGGVFLLILWLDTETDVTALGKCKGSAAQYDLGINWLDNLNKMEQG